MTRQESKQAALLGSGEDVAEFVLPVVAVVLGFVENLEAEDVILEILAEVLRVKLLVS